MPSLFLFFFLHRLGLAYGALNAFTFAQGQEASEFDQPQGKIIFRIIKLMVMSLTLVNFAPTLPIALLLTAVYGAHAFYLSTFDQNANRVAYNQYLQRFWRGFSALTIGLLGLQLALAGSSMAIALVAAAAFPFVFKELKLIISPRSRIGHLLHHFDDNFAKWAPLASLLVMPSTALARLLNYFVVAANVYRPIVDNISYITNRILSLNVMRFMSVIYRSNYTPNIIKNAYNATFGRLHDELEAFFAYYNRPAVAPAQIKEAVDIGNVAHLRPAIENLYKGRPRKAFIASTNIAQSAEQARILFRDVLILMTRNRQNFEAFLAQMATKSLLWRNMIEAVVAEDNVHVVLALVMAHNHRAENYAANLAQQPANIQELVTVIVDNINTVSNIIENPRRQLGADEVPGTSDKIPSGLAALFNKFFDGMAELRIARERQENAERQQALLDRSYSLIASIFDNSLRCQNALQGLIREETMQDFVHEPLVASWGEYVNQEIARAQARLVTAFTREVAYDPNGQWDENIQRQFGARVNLGYAAMVNAFFSFDPHNVDHQRIVANRFLPQQTEDETFRAFSSLIISRHTDLYEFFPHYIGQSFFHHLLYPTLFSAYTVEEMIARTQQVYAHTLSVVEANEAMPAWIVRWNNHWQNYLNTAYPIPEAELAEFEEDEFDECSNEALFNAYMQHQDNDQRALRLYDNSLSDEVRAQMVAEGNIGLVGAAKMHALIEAVAADDQNLPQGFADWSEFKKRQYLQMNKPIVRGLELNADLAEQAAVAEEAGIAGMEAELNAQRLVVSREFALVVLFSEGLVTHEHALHQKIGELGAIARFMNPEDKLQRLGYTN